MTIQERDYLVNYRINNAKKTLKEVRVHISNGFWNTAANRLYYACYYAVSALLLKHAINAKTHDGTKQMFHLHFIKTGVLSHETGTFYSRIFNKRQTGDYTDDFDCTQEDVLDLVVPAEELIQQIEVLLNTQT